jgi:hypothetical protein
MTEVVEPEEHWRLTKHGRRLATALAWALRWKALARQLRFGLRHARGHRYDLELVCRKLQEDCHVLRMERDNAESAELAANGRRDQARARARLWKALAKRRKAKHRSDLARILAELRSR